MCTTLSRRFAAIAVCSVIAFQAVGCGDDTDAPVDAGQSDAPANIVDGSVLDANDVSDAPIAFDALDVPDALVVIDASQGPDATPVEANCLDDQDDDGDGDTDCLDSDCMQTVHCLAQCPAPLVPLQLDSTDVPVTIVDNMTVSAGATASSSDLVANVAVQLDIAHTYTNDLILTLTGPNAQSVILSNRRGGGGDDYDQTIFLDSAFTSIVDGAPPFSGMFQPEEPLAAYVGIDPTGTWTLEASDNAGADNGTIDAFSVYLCMCTDADCELGDECSDNMDNDSDNLTDCDDPDCATVTECIPETQCTDSLDNDLDNLTDCLDDDCDQIDVCEFDTELTCDDHEDNDADTDTDCDDTDCSSLPVCVPEVDCHDTIDNDNDGDTDCQDVGCSSDPTCEINGETICDDMIDNDSDGLIDCEEQVCSQELHCLLACPMGDTFVQLAATDLPQMFADLATRTSTITNATVGTVSRAAVEFSATHTWVADLEIVLVSPANTTVELSTDNGGDGDDYIDTIFIDSAMMSITNGSAPFTGPFSPEGSLSNVNGQAAEGDWSLEVTDDANQDTGTFDEFQLLLCVTPP